MTRDVILIWQATIFLKKKF